MKNKLYERGMVASSYIDKNGGGGDNRLELIADGSQQGPGRPQDLHELIFDFSGFRFDDNDGEFSEFVRFFEQQDKESNISLYIFICLLLMSLLCVCVVWKQYNDATSNCYDCHIALMKESVKTSRSKSDLKIS